MYAIEINNLSYKYLDKKFGIKDINLKIKKGEFVILAGPNGSGKTTLFRHLNALIKPDKGDVIILGESVKKNSIKPKKLVGMVFQDADAQIVGETVFSDVAFGPENLCMPRKEIDERVIKALNAVGLSDYSDKRPHTLSGGEKRRLAIAGILAMDSEIIVFDEPFSNLDYPGTVQVLKEIVKLRKQGKTILISTHDIEKVVFYADRIIIMDNGKIVDIGSPDEKFLKKLEKFGIKEPCASKYGLAIESWLAS
jgi:biotin transport system ATP-binding protein